VIREAETFGQCGITAGPACGEMSKLEMGGLDYEGMTERAFEKLTEFDEDINLNHFHLPINMQYYTFILSFQTFKDTGDDYPLENFDSFFTPSIKILVKLKTQIFTTNKQPKKSIQIVPEDPSYSTNGLKYILPADTYAYTSTEPMILKFSRQVQFESFWLRLHHDSAEV
jgi:hypothetical protein